MFTQEIKIPSIKSIQKPIIYITAGNQGSHIINLIIKKILPKLKNFIIIHQTGHLDFDNFQKFSQKYKNYYPFDYIKTEHMGWIFKKASLIISRSGANTSQEIVAFNQKSILIPLPKSQQDEQLINAKWVKQQLPQQTLIIDQDKLSNDNLFSAIDSLLLVKKNSEKIITKTNLKLLETIHEII